MVVIRPAPKDKFGDPVGTDSEHQVENVAIDWSGTSLNNGHGEQLVSDVVLYLPPGSDIRGGDRVRLPDGDKYAVHGKPGVWQSPFTGRRPGISVPLQMVKGGA
ncbi:hypothetical protein G4X40_20175 [Rhodococcus sp. D2-41]|uniref:hypothetical protein n=1 Tax=Speluncibacter jeojiensis TaxID=2710754 RepID=UPI0024101EDC|nr:hypothetical protein [Rhodococcus sp. D2-41]MDG3012460.1 hypothetical protein [Rhodococcus sp. D2-41]